MIKSALEYFKKVTHKPEVITVHELPHTEDFQLIRKPQASSITCSTLQGVIDFCDKVVEKRSDMVIQVVGPEQVIVRSILDDEYRTRESYLQADRAGSTFRFGDYIPVEEAIIALQSLFAQDSTTKDMLTVIGNLNSESGIKVKDDGVTQRVEAKTGITTVANVDLPNPVTLKPYRTFSEVDQPASNFVIRMKQMNGGIHIALFEADGGQWKIEAMSNIKEHLAEKLGENYVVIS